MLVNGLPFLVTSSRGISLVTSRTAKQLVSSVERVVRIYGRAGFIVQTSMMDMEFEKLKDLLPNIALNTTAAQEHVGEIKRKIRVIKESARGMISTLPYEMLLKLVIIKLLHFCVMWMNLFPVKSRVSEKYSPRELVSRHKLDAKLHCKLPSEHIARCTQTQTSQIPWILGQGGEYALGLPETGREAIYSCL
jgi:hypothetical protein